MLLAVAAFLGFVSVAFGAYSEHALRAQVSDEMFRYLMTAIRYNQVHAVAGVAVGLALLSRVEVSRGLLALSGWGFVAGTVLFSGSIYLAALFDNLAFTIATPVGGMTFILSWLALAAAGATARHRSSRPFGDGGRLAAGQDARDVA